MEGAISRRAIRGCISGWVRPAWWNRWKCAGRRDRSTTTRGCPLIASIGFVRGHSRSKFGTMVIAIERLPAASGVRECARSGLGVS